MAIIQSAAQWLQTLPVIEALRISLWVYPLVSAAHIAAFALLFGAIATVDLRLVRAGRMNPVVDGWAIRIALVGFAAALATGSLLFGAKAIEYIGTPVLWWKFATIVVAGTNALLLHGLARRQFVSPLYVRIAASASLATWSGAILCGRLLGFV